MKNQFLPYRLMTVYAKSNSYAFKLDNVLVDVENQQFIYCRYMLQSEKDTNVTAVDCRIIKTPITVVSSNVVEIDHNDFINKLNRKNTKRVEYDELAIAFDIDNVKENRFSVFM